VEGANSSLLERIHFENVADGHDLLTSLSRIEHDIIKTTQHSRPPKKMKHVLIIIDSISSSLSTSLFAEGDRGTGAALLNEIQIALRRIARTRMKGQGHCVAFVTNGIVSSPADNGVWTRRPALGDQWRIADVRLSLENVRDVPTESDKGWLLRQVDARVVKHYAKCLDGSVVTISLDSSGVID
jgi:hypothetical protein